MCDEEFRPDPAELAAWSNEVALARDEYRRYPHTTQQAWRGARAPRAVPPWITASQAIQSLEQALEDLWAACHQVSTQQRLITRLYRRINELEAREGLVDAHALHGLRHEDTHDGKEGDGLLLAELRGECAS
jgi:hypothetical protein